MNCAEYRELVAAHSDGVLFGDELSSADRHAESCAPCRRLREQSAAVAELIGQRVAAASVSGELRASIGRSVRGGAPRVSPSTRWVVQGAMAAVALLALAALFRPQVSPMALVAGEVYALSSALPELADERLVSAALVARLEEQGWRSVGGRRGQWGPMRGRMQVLQAADGVRLAIHEMDVGSGFELPGGGIEVAGRTHYWVDGVMLSLAVEGDTLVCLAARMSRREFARRVLG